MVFNRGLSPIYIGIDKCTLQMAVSEHIGDGLERMSLCEHPGGKTVAEDMRALACDLDARDPDVVVDPVRQYAAVLDPMIWRA